MKNRLLFYDLKKYLTHKNALVITGMRQVGKTTIMKQLYDEVNYPKIWFDFENPLDTLPFENENYDAIYESLVRETSAQDRLFVFIDEIQNFPEITKIIKYHIDKYNVKYIVTGSSNYYLKNLFPESLSGRKFLFVLQPLSFNEYLFFNDQRVELKFTKDINTAFLCNSKLMHKKYSSDYADYIEYGGFPEVVTTTDIQTKKLILKNIFASFFEKDIKVLSDLKEVRELRDLILLLVPRAGNILDVSKLASELSISRPKVYTYLELLQGFFFLYLIPKYTKSIDRAVAGGKKVYFSDTGLLNIIGKVNEGQIFENSVANQLRDYGEISFYNYRNSAEIDFILNKEIAFEAKLRGTEKDVMKLKKLAEKLNIRSHFLISKNYSELAKMVSPICL